MSGNTAQRVGTWHIERTVDGLTEPVLAPWPIRARNVARRWLERLYAPGIEPLPRADASSWAVVITATWITAPFVQAIATQAANSTYRVFSKFIESISSGRHDIDGKWHLLILRTEDGRLRVEIPGDLPRGAHSALVRDLDDLVAGDRDGETIRIFWDQESERWVIVHS
jgi:hypothetical protein